jgi:beta-glucosidase/6-phospho-beta-glucosidase/beta-galactosidase
MDATWTMYYQNQKFFTEKAQRQFKEYLDETFQERQHYYKKKSIINDELVPTLRPTCESGMAMYEQTRKEVVMQVLHDLGETNQLQAVLRKINRMDPWSELEEAYVEDEEDLAEDGNELMGACRRWR